MKNATALAVTPEEHIARRKAMKMSRAEYCRQHDIDYWRMVHWERHGIRRRPAGAFVRAVMPAVAGEGATPRARLVVDGYLAIEIDATGDPAWIVELLNGIRRRS